DFRTLNMIVPEQQVRDTVNLFRLPGQRMLSLRFLAAALLGYNIQDARAALLLYREYQRLKE
ncbi:PAN2, partial [Symbiodinium sp. KB8]